LLHLVDTLQFIKSLLILSHINISYIINVYKIKTIIIT